MSDISALLELQNDDLAIHDIETRLAALEPRIRELDTRRQRIVDTIERQSNVVAAEEKKQAFLRDKIAEHRELIEKNQAQLDMVKTMKQATAAAAQMEQAKAIVACFMVFTMSSCAWFFSMSSRCSAILSRRKACFFSSAATTLDCRSMVSTMRCRRVSSSRMRGSNAESRVSISWIARSSS